MSHDHHDHFMLAPAQDTVMDDNMKHDHVGHDHGDHGGHDMGNSTTQPMHHMMMSMFFHFGFKETILFEFWATSSLGGLLASMIGITLMAIFYEGLKYFRDYLFWKSHIALQYRSVQMPIDKNGIAEEDHTVVQVVREVIRKHPPSMLSGAHILQTFLHMVQITISYMIMLIFMTFNVWLCVAVVLGSTIGYFLFGWKKSSVVDITEHCH